MKVRIELMFELDAKVFAALIQHLRTDLYSRASFNGGQQSIEADGALQTLIGELRRQVTP
jgi:hypothetical protein